MKKKIQIPNKIIEEVNPNKIIEDENQNKIIEEENPNEIIEEVPCKGNNDYSKNFVKIKFDFGQGWIYKKLVKKHIILLSEKEREEKKREKELEEKRKEKEKEKGKKK